MAKEPTKNVDHNGKEIKEYPKLVRAASGQKVRVFNKNEEDALPKFEEDDDKKKGWKK